MLNFRTSKTLALCFQYTYGKPLPPQSFTIVLNNQTFAIDLDTEGCSNPIPLDTLGEDGFCIIDRFEMIDLNTGYPTHKQTIYFQNLTASVLIIQVLPPPIIANLTHERPHAAIPPLTAQQIQYFKDNGKNALLFVHGYNLPFGQYGCYPESYSLQQQNMAISEHHLKDPFEHSKNISVTFQKSAYTRTIACPLHLQQPDEIIARFPALSLYYQAHPLKLNYKAEYNPEGLGETEAFFNGTDAKHWFTHMEYNFNRAAGFNGKHYKDYTRILNVYWPCGNGLTDFALAEKMADDAALRFLALIQQLLTEKICIHIVAHSLGCRMVLQSLRLLAKQDINVKEPIEQTVLWQPAVPNTLLTQDLNFTKIENISKTISVLYSTKDSVLRTLYTTAQLKNLPIQQALGYTGPKGDPKIQWLQKSGKLICVDQSQWLFGHSFMKLPTEALMREIYQQYIIGGQYGIQSFGNYAFNDSYVLS